METFSPNLSHTVRTTHPLVLTAAASITALSFAGIGFMAGWLPGPSGQASAPAVTPVVATATPAPSTAPAPVSIQQTFNLPQDKSATTSKPAAVTARAATPVARTRSAPETASSRPATVYASPRVTTPAAPVCSDCGRIAAIREVVTEGKPSGGGAVAGGVVGGLLGNQVGAGSGKDLATLVGIFGGAIAGHHIEKNMKEAKRYDVTVRLDDGRTQIVSSDTHPAWHVGDRVKLRNGEISSDSGNSSGNSLGSGTSLVSTLGSID